MKLTIAIFVILWWAIGLGAMIYLVMNNHPWFAFFVLIATCSIRVRWDD